MNKCTEISPLWRRGDCAVLFGTGVTLGSRMP